MIFLNEQKNALFTYAKQLIVMWGSCQYVAFQVQYDLSRKMKLNFFSCLITPDWWSDVLELLFLKTNVFLLIALWFICIQMSRLAKWNRKFYHQRIRWIILLVTVVVCIKSRVLHMKTIESDPIQWIYQKFLTKQMIELTNDDLNSWSKEDHYLLDWILSIILWK